MGKLQTAPPSSATLLTKKNYALRSIRRLIWINLVYGFVALGISAVSAPPAVPEKSVPDFVKTAAQAFACL